MTNVSTTVLENPTTPAQRSALAVKPQYRSILRFGESRFSDCKQQGICCVCTYRGKTPQESWQSCVIRVTTKTQFANWDDRLMCKVCAATVIEDFKPLSTFAQVATIVAEYGPGTISALYSRAVSTGMNIGQKEFSNLLILLTNAERVYAEGEAGRRLYSVRPLQPATKAPKTERESKADRIVALVYKNPGKTKAELVEIAPEDLRISIRRDYLSKLAKTKDLVTWRDPSTKKYHYYHPDHAANPLVD